MSDTTDSREIAAGDVAEYERMWWASEAMFWRDRDPKHAEYCERWLRGEA